MTRTISQREQKPNNKNKTLIFIVKQLHTTCKNKNIPPNTIPNKQKRFSLYCFTMARRGFCLYLCARNEYDKGKVGHFIKVLKINEL